MLVLAHYDSQPQSPGAGDDGAGVAAMLETLPALLPQQPVPVLHQRAPAVALPSPSVRLLTDSTRGGRRHLRLLVAPGRATVASFRLVLTGQGAVRDLRVAGQPVPAASVGQATTGITFSAPRPAGKVLALTTTPGPVHVTVTTRSAGLPPVPGLPSLPATIVPAPGYNSFTTQVIKMVQL